MEQKENNEEKLIKVLSLILHRLDTLEVEQSKHKQMFYKVRENLVDANDLINQILDILEIDNPELYGETMKRFGIMKDVVLTLENQIDESEDFDKKELLELMNQIVGDA